MIDCDSWDPISVDDLAAIFSGVGIDWWISGGWAIDLFLGRTTREHKDTDVSILRADQLLVQGRLRDWELFKTKQPGLAPWPRGEYLESPVNCVWARRGARSPWAFEVMFADTEEDQWVYRRLPSIRGPIAQMGLRTESGIPYIRPEIQLLYKATAAYRPADLADLTNTLPRLPEDSRRWLLDCLRAQYPGGHEWVQVINRFTVTASAE